MLYLLYLGVYLLGRKKYFNRLGIKLGFVSQTINVQRSALCYPVFYIYCKDSSNKKSELLLLFIGNAQGTF